MSNCPPSPLKEGNRPPGQDRAVETAELAAAVFRDTGIKIGMDDPLLAVLLEQRRNMGIFADRYGAEQEVRQTAFLEQQGEMQEIFLHQLRLLIQESTDAAAKMEQQKQVILAEVLNSNANERKKMGTKLFAAVSKELRQENERYAADFANRLKSILLRLGITLLIVQTLALAGLLALLR